jgi:serine phosphatase RsbU (regulator of sigma subunit)/anti-sigma regulatory factor (Ser/Thr protein kinase)
MARPISRADRWHSSISMTVGRDTPSSIRRQVASALRASSVGDDVQADVELLVSEVVSNVIRHEDSIAVDVEVSVDADYGVTVTVTSGGSAPSVALVHPSGPPESSSESGRGLDVLDSLASAWGTRRQDRKTAVWFTVRDAEPDTAISAARLIEAGAASESTDPSWPSAAITPGIGATDAELTTEQATIDAAVKTADAADSARAARAMAATLAAKSVAEAAARTVEAVQFQADELALAVATAASVAAVTVSGSIAPGGDAEAALAALKVGATVIAAAAAKSEETARAAVLVARAVAAAAEAVAATTAAEAAAIESEVLDVAVAVQAVAAATAQRLASDTLDRGAAVALATRQAAAASDRLREANRNLVHAGHHDRTVARALQDAMLPQLPDYGTLELAARYLTAAEEDQVGGDWYDAIILPNGSTSLVIGDVIGHDIVAAATMGQLRNLLRALIWDRDEVPSAVVGRLDRVIRDLRINTMATLILARVEPRDPSRPGGSTSVSWTNAGHPAPILVHADGTVVALDDSTDILLGVDPGGDRRDHTHLVPPGATLLLYTDGLVELRGEHINAGHQRLLDAVGRHSRLDPEPLLDAVLAEMVGDRPGDDVAVLAVRFPVAH